MHQAGSIAYQGPGWPPTMEPSCPGPALSVQFQYPYEPMVSEGLPGGSQFQTVLSAHDTSSPSFRGWATCGGALPAKSRSCGPTCRSTARALAGVTVGSAVSWIQSAHSSLERLRGSISLGKIQSFQEQSGHTEVINVLTLALRLSPRPGLCFLHCYKISIFNPEIKTSHFINSSLLSSKPFVWKACMQEGRNYFYRTHVL